MSSVEIATLKARVEFLEKKNFREEKERREFLEVESEQLKQKYEKFKKAMTNYIHENIIEKLNYDEDASRLEVVDAIDDVTDE